ncbi:MAG: PspC domain-containing protein [Melioribacteraceae bacterium]|nr:PspC domain-containing protein [Melioribacteraceae bacterium]
MKKKLYRSRKEKIIGGVAGGLGDYFNIDPVIVRVLFVVLSILHGSGILVYFILWIVIPEEPFEIAYGIKDDTQQNDNENKNINDNLPLAEIKKNNTPTLITGGILIFIGIIFLLNNIIPSFNLSDLFPYILILVGILLISNSFKK